MTAVGPTDTVTRPRGPRPGGWLRQVPFDPRNNSLNLVRLLLAFAVLVSHSFTLAGWGPEPSAFGDKLGEWAVVGFFVLSGYLVVGSRLRSTAGVYLIHRVARIFPGFLVCLVVVALGFAPVAYLTQHGTLDGFLTTPTTPLHHLWSNAFLRMNAYGVAGTLADAPLPGVWNGSLWSLEFEFLCYVVVGLLCFVPVFRRSAWPMGLAFAVSVLLQANAATVLTYVGPGADLELLLRMLPFFLGGAWLYTLGDRIRYSAVVAVPLLVVSLTVSAQQPTFGSQLTAPLLAYVVLWVSLVLPAPRLVLRHDVSYGLYIYAFPVQQLVSLAGGVHWNPVLYLVVCTAGAGTLAVLSWLLVERPVMERVKAKRPTGTTASTHRAPATASAGGVLPEVPGPTS